MKQSVSRVNELANIFIHATKVSDTGADGSSSDANIMADGDGILGDGR